MKSSCFPVKILVLAALAFGLLSSNARAAVDSPDYRKYAPDREVDILHLTLDVTPDFVKRTVAGSATWKFKPIAKPFAELKLDGVNLRVESVTSTEKILGYQVTDEKVIVTFADALPVGKEASVTVRYSAEPERGMYFRTPELGYNPEDMHLWTQGEPHEARFWYPSYDYPNEKFTVEMICHAPEGIVVLANGHKVSEEKGADGLMAVRWLQDKPMANYLVCLVAGRLKSVEAMHGQLPMHWWTAATEIEHAMNSFTNTLPIMKFFEQEIGVPYPWDKYDQVCIQDFHWGGMENVSLTTLNNNTMFPPSFENLRNSQGLIAHELAHQWFGDLLTCKDWSHLWLNEGFASFYDLLYVEHKDGRDEFLYQLHEGRKSLTSTTNFSKSIVWRKYEDAENQFDDFAYGKGSWVLNMLRNNLGPELYRQCIKTYVERHKFDNVVTEDLRAVVEELSGRSFDQFFDQWVYHTGFPRLDVDYSWDEHTKLAKITVRQSQAVSEQVPLFNVPLPVKFKLKSGVVEKTLTVKERAEDFYIPLEAQPELVRVDPNVSILGVINFRPPGAMLVTQLTDKSDALGRYLAAEQFAERRDGEALAKLKTALNSDDFWPVRIVASRGLRAMQSDESFDALKSSLKQSNARVRKQVVSDATSFYRPAAFELAQTVIATEKNPDIVGTALGALVPLGTNVRGTLVYFLNTNSWRHHLMDTAMNAMRSQNDPYYLEPLRATLERRRTEVGSRTLANGLSVLAQLSRDEENKDTTRDFLASFANDTRQNVKVAALNALGALRDEKALPILERFTIGAKNTPVRTAAERAIETIRANRKGTLEAGDVRREVLELQRQNRDLRRDFDALKKKVEAGNATAPARKK